MKWLDGGEEGIKEGWRRVYLSVAWGIRVWRGQRAVDRRGVGAIGWHWWWYWWGSGGADWAGRKRGGIRSDKIR